MRLRTRRQWAVFAAALFVLEVLIATVWRHVPVLRTDLGDYFVVILVYATVKAVLPPRFTRSVTGLALAVFAFGFAVEGAQALGLADRLGLTSGGAARIVLGATFDWGDVAMYAAGCLTAWLLDGERAARGSP